MIQNPSMVSHRAMIFYLLSAGAVGLTCPAFAQSADPAGRSPPAATTAPASDATTVADIVVTATRQNSGSQKVPFALTAVGSRQLASQGITTTSQLNQLSPSLFVLNTVSDGSPRFTLRGLTFSDTTANGSPAVATYIDDVYQSFQFGISTALFDLQRVEILRGPQGTTFGRNTTGGAVDYFSQTPTNQFEGYVSGRLAGGDQPQRFLEGVMNVPLIDDKLALRVSLHADSKSDYVYDQTLGRKRGASDSQTGRVQLRYTPTTDTTVNLTVFGLGRTGDEPMAHGQFLPATVSPSQLALTPGDYYDRFENYGATLRVEQVLGDFKLTSITHYRQTSYDTSQDLDGLPQDFLYYSDHDRATQYGQEVRVSSDPSRRLSGIVGGYFEKDRVSDHLNFASLTGGVGSDYNNYLPSVTTTTAYAIFANLTFKITDTLSVIGGVRQSVEDKVDDGTSLYFLDYDYDWTPSNIIISGAAPVLPTQDLSYHITQRSTPLTWDVTLNYNPSRDLLFFARAAKGFRSGGVNAAPFISDPTQLPTGNPAAFHGESVQSYEAGFKAGLFNNRLRVNASGYHYDYTDQQVTEYINTQSITENAGRSVVDGGELEIVASPMRGLELHGSASYTDAHYTQYQIPSLGANYQGNTLIQSPNWNLNGNVNYIRPLTSTYDLAANVGASYRSTIFFDSANSAELRSGPQTFVNLRLGVEPSSGKGLSVVAFVNNLTDRRPLDSGFPFIPGSYYVKYFDPGRMIGIDAAYKW